MTEALAPVPVNETAASGGRKQAGANVRDLHKSLFTPFFVKFFKIPEKARPGSFFIPYYPLTQDPQKQAWPLAT